jgi:Uncharacterised protein family (UPF0158)
VASETWSGSGPVTSENAERCVAAGSPVSSCAARVGAGDGGSGEALRRMRCLVVRACEFHRAVRSPEHNHTRLALADLRRSRRGSWATAWAWRRDTTRSEMESKEQRSALRAAVYRGDGPAVVELLRGVSADGDSLQLAGDGVIAAVMQRVDGAAELARDLVVGLRQRGWAGDDELADQLQAQLGSGPVAMLRALPAELEELAGILEGDPLSVGGRIDIRTGAVSPQAAIEYAVETGQEDEDTADDPERWLAVHGEGSREGYRDMELFIASVEDPGRAERLAIAIRGRGAFRRFKDELARLPGELERWHAFSEERQRGRARSWLAAAGYRVLPVDHRDS